MERALCGLSLKDLINLLASRLRSINLFERHGAISFRHLGKNASQAAQKTAALDFNPISTRGGEFLLGL